MERKHYETREIRTSGNYIAKFSEYAGECREIVFRNGEQIHFAEFSASNLGQAKRGEYLGVMCASVVDRFEREAREEF